MSSNRTRRLLALAPAVALVTVGAAACSSSFVLVIACLGVRSRDVGRFRLRELRLQLRR